MHKIAALAVAAFALACRTAPPSSSQFVYCPPAKFANCTTAKCEPTEGGYACKCFLDDRYSATSSASSCVAASDTTAQSRYHPVQSLQQCTTPMTDSPIWAWCLGVSCTIRENGDVICNCTAPPSGVQAIPYIVVTSSYLPDGCKGAGMGQVWSSATPDDVQQIMSFLRTQPGLQTLPAPVLVGSSQ